MTRFHYFAIDARGKSREGTINADHAKQARELLRQKNLMPTAIHLSTSRHRLFLHTISTKMLSLITRQWATLIHANLPITDVLTAVSAQHAHPQTKTMLLSVRERVLAGHSLAAALCEHPQTFSALYCGIVASGEKSGQLAQVLDRLADYTEQQFKLKQKIHHALIYPTALIVVSFGIIIFLLGYVVPKMISVYAHLHQTLPLLTKMLIGSSQCIKSFGVYMIFANLIALWGFCYALKKKPLFRERFHRFLLRVPWLGKSLQTINTTRYARTLAMLCSSGIPIVESMTTAATLITNLRIRQAVTEATQQVREGTSIHLALKKTTFFSPLAIHLISSGEASGTLETLLEHVALQQEAEITQLIDTLLTLFEPALIIVMGGVVLFIVLAVLLPIFDLNQLTQ